MAADKETILIATRSSGKLRELKELLTDFDLKTVDLESVGIPVTAEEDSVEVFDTFRENALAKGRYFHKLTGMPTLADDSGLVVDALGGAPGVYSKRFSGRTDLSGVELDQANNERLLRELDHVMTKCLERREPVPAWTARYMCVAAYVGEQGELWRVGSVEGEVVPYARGDGGFGYDPYVEVPELGGTMAEAGWRQKAKVSHRARAFRALLPALRELGWA